MWSRAVAAVGMLTLAVGLTSGGSPAAVAPGAAPPWPATATGADYTAPVRPVRVLRGFEAPVGPYGPGHRGVDLLASPGAPVRAAGAGVVRFAGSVAGRGVLVVSHPDGITTEYEPVTLRVRAGDVVRAGQLIGTVHGSHRGCAGSCLHWGARRGSDYLDPLTLLRPLGPVVLLPWPRAG